MFTVLELKMIQHISKNAATSSSLLAATFAVSIRKCQMDIVEINRKFKDLEGGIRIDIDRMQGYSLVARCQKSLVAFIHELNVYLDQTLLLSGHKNEKVMQILRFVLLKHDTLKIEDISLHLNMSTSSIHTYLKEARKIFEHYDISLQSTPYYGYRVDASAMKRISALLDYCDIPMSYSTARFIKPACVDAYHISAQQLQVWQARIVSAFSAAGMRVSEKGFARLVLLACLFERDLIDTLHLHMVSMVQSLTIYEAVQKLGFNEAQTFCLAAIAHAYQVEVLRKPEVAQTDLIAKADLLYQLVRHHLALNTGIDMGTKHDFPQLHCFLYRYLSHKMVHILEFNTSAFLVAKLSSLAASQSIAYEILQLLERHPNESRHSTLTYELMLIIYNKACSHHSEYAPIRCLIVNDFGEIMTQQVKTRLNLHGFEVVFKTISSHEMADVNYREWDFVVSSTLQGKPDACAIPFFYVDYFSDFPKSRKIWKTIIRKRRRKIDFLNHLEDPLELTVDATAITIASALYHVIGEWVGDEPRHFKTILSALNHQSIEPKRNVVTICIFSNKIAQSQRIVVKNSHPIRIAHQDIGLFEIVLVKPVKDFLAIKQIDSGFR